MKCSQCKPYKIHIEGLELCVSLNLSLNLEMSALTVFSGITCPRAQFLNFSGRGHLIFAISSGFRLLCIVCAGP